MKKMLISLLCCLTTTANAGFWSDLWWNPNESGWGMTLTQQDETIFTTFFVYGNDSKPTWFAATLDYDGTASYKGVLFQTVGSHYGKIFDPASVTATVVGTATFTPQFEAQGSFVYTNSGVVVTKTITRQTFKSPDITDIWQGVFRNKVSGCVAASSNGTFNDGVLLEARDNGTTVSGNLHKGTQAACAFTGAKTTYGKILNVDGTYSCPSGDRGTFTIFNGQYLVTTLSVRMQLKSNVNGCFFDGFLGATTSSAF